MKIVTLSLSIFLMMTIHHKSYASYYNDVIDSGNGIYSQMLWVSRGWYSGGEIQYIVDTIAKVCMVFVPQNTNQIPCESLAQREEWKNIITWVKQPDSTADEK